MMKFKEILKSILLTFLIIISIVLSSKIWFSEELWSGNYNSFHYARKNIFSGIFSFFNKNSSDSVEFSNIFFPKHLRVNENSKNIIFYPGSEEYNYIDSYFKKELKSIISTGEVEEITEEEYKKACVSFSVFFDFYSHLPLQMMYDYYDVSPNSSVLKIKEVKNAFITFENQGKTALYLCNDGSSCKITYNKDNKEVSDKLREFLKKVPDGNVSSSFAFENNFDKPSEHSEKLLLNPYLLINLNDTYLQNTQVINNPDWSDSKNSEKYIDLARLFNVNIGSARRFVDANGTVNLVENYGTLKFYRNGLIDYSSSGDHSGIDLTMSVDSYYSAVQAASDFVFSITPPSEMEDKNKYVYSKVIEKKGKFYIYFDLTYDGIPVLCSYDEKNSGISSHAISVEIDDNKITSYKHMIFSLTKIPDKIVMPSSITALDKFYTEYNINDNPDIMINDIYNIYYFPGRTNRVNERTVISLSDGTFATVNR